jgi:hypothetical protein
VHQGLQHQPLLGGHQQGGQLVGIEVWRQIAVCLGGAHQGGQPQAKPLHEGFTRFPRRAGCGPLQLGEQHSHQPRVLLEQVRMDGHQSGHLVQRFCLVQRF